MRLSIPFIGLTAIVASLIIDSSPCAAQNPVLRPEILEKYVARFNADDNELYKQYIPNDKAAEFLKANVPLFECPDATIEQTYYFRWWTYRKHIKETPDGFVVTEFLPTVPWAGKYNTISCAVGHHLYEGRWLRDPRFLDDYSRFWFGKYGRLHAYSNWIADAIWARYCVTGKEALIKDLSHDLFSNYEAWKSERRDPSGLFWQDDNADGMEMSISGTGCRPTINSYMYGEANATARIEELAGGPALARDCRLDAANLWATVRTSLWDPKAEFFMTRARQRKAGDARPPLADVRELCNYAPWYFGLADSEHSVAWKQITDTKGFAAPFGLTTVEQRHPKFAISYSGHECQWNGPSWPYSTSITLTALANLLNNYQQEFVNKKDYFSLLHQYAASHQLKRDDGKIVPWIDEDLNPLTGDWIARSRLKIWENGTWSAEKGGVERGKDYNHSTFCDLVITGLVGLRPRADDKVEVHPLAPDDWAYFCLDNVAYHGRTLTILWDKTGERYHKGAGLRVLADGVEIGAASALNRLVAQLPPAKPEPPTEKSAAGWVKSPANPVLGGKLGTCFDVALLKDDDTFRMWFSWRSKKSVALVESPDGVHWSEPAIVFGPNPANRWESDINRPVVVKIGDKYHMWYTGQDDGSHIGYATSDDGKTWRRMSDKPVLSPDQPWEKVAVMCPHVLWDADAKQFRMWYSGGEQYEPNAIGYATSPDGIKWTKWPTNPIFAADLKSEWEKHKVTACQVIRQGDWHLMFYIGFKDENYAQIGMARSRDGITAWERLPANPIIKPDPGAWDASACYKPFAIHDGNRWLLWYNGRHDAFEQIGLATHAGDDFGFSK